jgi:hypothetical protein
VAVMSRYRHASNLIAMSMHLGPQPSSREWKPASAVLPVENAAAQVLLLARRLDRLIKRVQLFSVSCLQAPEELRNNLKQLVDLALVELEEGGKALERFRSDSPETADPVSISLLPSVESLAGSPLQETPADSGEITEQAVPTSNEVLASDENLTGASPQSPTLPTLGQLDLSYDTMANLADIPEASDLNAILARLEATSANDTNNEQAAFEQAQRPKAGESSTRERLLEFEVCRMQAADQVASTCAEPESPAEPTMNSPSEATSNAVKRVVLKLPKSTATDQAPAPERSQWEGSQREGAIGTSETSELEDTSPESKPLESASCASTSVSASGPQVNDHESGSVAAGVGPASLVPATAASSSPLSTSSDVTGRAPKKSSTIGATGNTGEKKNADQRENANPLDSIRPDNLNAILSLKEELDQLLHEYKTVENRSVENS